jgi:cytochrome c556
MRVWGLGGVCVALALGVFLCGSPVEAQKSKGKTRPAETKFLMRAINQPHCGSLGKLLKDGPADDKAWETALCHASVLNEMSFVLMDDGRCPDKEWAGAAKALRECSAKVMEAARAKDLEGAQAAFKKLVGACSGCHSAHKGK